jgi:TP53 regulating kinase-like protein
MPAVYKVRKPLGYRLRALDESLRRQRTLREAEMIHQAKRAGIASPFLFDVDVAGAILVMEYVSGRRLKEFIGSAPKDDAIDVFHGLGGDAARLHAAGIMHGDLTTANVVMRSGKLVFIDFGLSVRTTRLEDHAVDLRLIKETLVGAHPEVAAFAMDAFCRGYSKVVGEARTRAVLRQLRSIERRGRYARVT